MATCYHHALSSVRHFGGKWEDYIDIHQWFDVSKEHEASFRHRALRHHTHGIFECERHFGPVLTNSDGKIVFVRQIAEQHIMEDFSGFIPTVHDWLKEIPAKEWMQPSTSYQKRLMERVEDVERRTKNK